MAPPRALGLAAPTGWRQATAARVFVLALVVGQSWNSGTGSAAIPTLLAVAVVNATAVAIDSTLFSRWARWLTIPECAVVAYVVALSPLPEATAPLVAAPLVAAGVRGGPWSLITGTVLSGLALVSAQATSPGHPAYGPTMPWVAVGFGAGALTSWQSRRDRAFEESQRATLEARQWLSNLNQFAISRPQNLDPAGVAQEIIDELATLSARPAWVVVEETERSEVLAGPPYDVFRPDLYAASPPSHRLQLADTSGRVVWLWQRDQPIVDEGVHALIARHGLALEAALLFQQVRTLASSEERQRIARDIHDGAAQDVASLGYSIDELMTSNHTLADQLAPLRSQVSQIVGELRHSIFDLRTPEGGSVRDELVQQMDIVARSTTAATTFVCDAEAEQLPTATKQQLVAIAREALTNARRHSGASVIEMALRSDGAALELLVADNGTRDKPVAKDGHFGLATMRERAERIHCTFEVRDRDPHGTAIRVTNREVT